MENRFYKTLAILVVILTVVVSGCASQKNNLYDRSTSNSEHNILTGSHNKGKDRQKALDMPGNEHERLGDIYFKRGQLQMALIKYEKALRLNPENTRVRYKKGLLYIAGKRNQEAIGEFQDIVKQKPGYALAFQGLGQAFFQLKKYNVAEKHLSQAVKLEPKLWKAHNLLGIVNNYNRNYDRAVQEYKAAIALKPENGFLFNNLGLSYMGQKEYEKAVQSFREALKLTKTSRARIYNNLGLVLSGLGRYASAMEAFKKGGDEAQAYNNIGCIYLHKGEYVEAVRSFEKAVETRPTYYEKASDNLKKAKTNPAYKPLFDLSEKKPVNKTISEKEMEMIVEKQIPDYKAPQKFILKQIKVVQ